MVYREARYLALLQNEIENQDWAKFPNTQDIFLIVGT